MTKPTLTVAVLVVVVFITVAAVLAYVYNIFSTPIQTASPLPTASPTPAETAAPTPSQSPDITPLPSPRISTDLNWGGYAVATDFANPQPVVTMVSASWTVPQISVSKTDTFSAIWVGIGGTFGTTLIQAGTEQDCINGQIAYSAWYEFLPQASVTIGGVTVAAGDIIMATIRLVNPASDVWSIYLANLSNGESFNQTFTYASSRLSAEWIVERPTVNGRLSQLADFGQVTLSNCTATVNGVTGDIGSFNPVQTVLVDRQGAPLVSVTDISGDGKGFTVNYVG